MRLIDADALAAKIMMDAPDFMDGGSSITKAFILAMVKTRSITPTVDAIPVVRCKNCKHRPKQTEPPKAYGFSSIEFPEWSKCPCQCDDRFYSWYPEDNWFCADGERRTEDA